ncbi:MAG TPA: GNAT family N-acetyltransferase [Candidatus Baltobacteraceae bacterium]|nr:GNAT family N-acetyltransferase [Candidatus Baltobacteraceae bacterium]
MPEEPQILSASADEVASFARSRCRDEHAEKLYVEVAQAGAYVAKDVDGTAIGIAFARRLDDESFLSELFVEPSFRGQGVASQLLAPIWNAQDEVARSALFDAPERGAAAFLLRRGLAMQTPVLEVSGSIPRENELARMAAGSYRFGTEPLEPGKHRGALAQLDREVRGTSRSIDHAYFSESGRGFIFRRDEEIAGYVYLWPSGRIGPLAAASQTYVVQFFAFALAALRSTFDASWCVALVPGTNLRMLRAAMRAGLTVQSLRIFAGDNGNLDLSRYAGFHPLLF